MLFWLIDMPEHQNQVIRISNETFELNFLFSLFIAANLPIPNTKCQKNISLFRRWRCFHLYIVNDLCWIRLWDAAIKRSKHTIFDCKMRKTFNPHVNWKKKKSEIIIFHAKTKFELLGISDRARARVNAQTSRNSFSLHRHYSVWIKW